MKPVLFFSLFQIVIVVIYLIITSLISFFHFLLDHQFQMIESWSYRNAWEIIGVTKLIALWPVVKFVDVKFPTESHLKNIFIANKRLPDWSIVTYIIFTYSYFYFFTHPVINDTPVYLPFLLSSFIGTLIFYGADLILIYILDQAFLEQRLSQRIVNCLFFTFLFSFSTSILMPFHQSLGPFILFHFVTLLIIFEIFKEKWINLLGYILFFACPLAAIFGFDPIWGAEYTIFKPNSQLEYFSILILWVLSIYYLYKRNKNVRSRLIKKKI